MNRKKLNAIYLPSTLKKPDTWLEVANRLYLEENIVPQYFMYLKDESNTRKEYEWSNSCYFHCHFDAWKGIGGNQYEGNFLAIDDNFCNLYGKYELIACKMMDRMDPDHKSFEFTHRQRFFREQLQYWCNVIDNEGIDIIISPTMPHRVYDYALYVASKIMNVEFLTFQMTPFSGNSLISSSIEKMPEYLKIDKHIIDNTEKYIDEDREAYLVQRLNQLRGSYKDAKPDYMANQDRTNSNSIYKTACIAVIKKLKSFSNYKDVIKLLKQLCLGSLWSPYVKLGKMPDDSKFNFLHLMCFKLLNKKSVAAYKIKYEKNISCDVPKQYLFFALHYQPEETSCPAGGIYVDQLLIIDMLLKVFPKDISIVIKEHGSQFHPYLSGSLGRTHNFYDRISQYGERVTLLDVNQDPFSLIDGALATVTITGTIGWESIVRGVPAIVFGRAWYEHMPNAYRINNVEDLKSVVNPISNTKILSCDIDKYHKYLNHYLISAVHDEQYYHIDLPFEKSVDNITTGIIRHLNRVNFFDFPKVT